MTQTFTYINDMVSGRSNCSASGVKIAVGKIHETEFYFNEAQCKFCGKTVGVDKENQLNVHVQK